MKKIKVILFIFCAWEVSSHAQNLIYNGGFDLYSTCPSALTQITYSLGWYSANSATPDYLNTCALYTSEISVPNNFCGFSYPKNGNAYSGLAFAVSYNTSSYWVEYVQSEISELLEANEKYHIRFFVQRANYIGLLAGTHKNMEFALKNLGLHISTDPIHRQDSYFFDTITPQIINTGGYITDTLDWVEISGDYIAGGGERYITIGYFSDINNLDTLRINGPNPGYETFGESYYYIDSVSIVRVDNVPIVPNVFTPNEDGINDEWIVLDAWGYQCTVFNRWGDVVYEGKNSISWNGKILNIGNECSSGVYYYVLQKKQKKISGFIQLF